jgi:hypothetical protein
MWEDLYLLHKDYRRFCGVLAGGYEVQVLKLHVLRILKKKQKQKVKLLKVK